MLHSPFIWSSLLAAAVVGVVAPRSDAQIDRARRALVKVEVTDRGIREALEIRKSKKLTWEQKRKKLEKIPIRQTFRLLVSGVAIARHDIVTPALHPNARVRVMITFSDGARHEAAVVGTDPHTNLALVRSPVPVPHHLDLYIAEAALKQGVVLVGHTRVTAVAAQGLVTKVRMGATLKDMYGVNYGEPIPLGSVFVVAAPTTPCNPGTACLDRDGKLIGVVLGCAPAQVMQHGKGGAVDGFERSFVVPSRRVVRVVRALREHGRVVRAHFGMLLSNVSGAMRAQMPSLPPCAATVTQLEEHGPAAKAGVRANDIVLAIDSKQPRDLDHLREALTDCAPGKKATLKILRAGKELKLTVEPIDMSKVANTKPVPPAGKK
ncbi:MAG: S1C family serine protease [Planctomycetota bacterium]|jgi:serine protease Do